MAIAHVQLGGVRFVGCAAFHSECGRSETLTISETPAIMTAAVSTAEVTSGICVASVHAHEAACYVSIGPDPDPDATIATIATSARRLIRAGGVIELQVRTGDKVAVKAAGPVASVGLIELSATSIDEDASINDVVGTLSVTNGSGTYTFSITADPDSKFQIANDDELQLAATLDYETATSHSVTVQADNGVDDPIARTFSISVGDVGEASFGLTHTATPAPNTSNLNSYTFSSVNFGSTTTNKEVIVLLAGRYASGTHGAVTVSIGGNAATEDRLTVNTAGLNTIVGIYRATVAATSGDIVVAVAVGATMGQLAVDVFELVGRGSGPNVAGGTSNATLSLTKIAGGATVGIGHCSATTSVDSTTATGLTKQVDTATLEGAQEYSTGYSTGDSAGSATVGLVFSVTGTPTLIANAYAAYGP